MTPLPTLIFVSAIGVWSVTQGWMLVTDLLIALAIGALPVESALDPETQDAILDLITDLMRSQGLAVLLVTHRSYVALRMADRTAVLNGGRLTFEEYINAG